jgi:hypothetical protein
MAKRSDKKVDKDARRQQLVALGAERLAEALLDLADQAEEAEDLVHRLVATPKESEKKFKAKLAAIKRFRGFGDWRVVPEFAATLRRLLDDLRAGVQDPKTGLEHVAAFYETDEWVFNHYDDSSGTIGDVYRYNARDLFILYASRCPDKEWVANLVLRLYQHDGYGVRDRILECSGQYLPEAVMRGMVDRLWAMAKEKAEKYSDLRATSGIEALAKELKDPKLFEKARRAGWPKLNSAACVDIAQAYFEADDARTALSWLERIPAEDVFKARERDKLLAEVYEKLGDQDKRQEVAWRIFRSGRSKEALVSLLEVIGEAERDKVIEGEAASILSSERLSYSDGWFLMQVGRVDEAEKYLLDRAARLDGDHYQSLLPLAQGMEKHGRALVASVIYRALIDSTMRRAQAKYYHHAVRYLKILERLAPGIADWRGFEPHSEYMVEFREAHKRKTSLWARYSE